MDRLINITDSYGNNSIEYDASGNITYKGDIGNYEYQHPQKPHAVTSTENIYGIIDSSNVFTNFYNNGKIRNIYGEYNDFYFGYGPDKEKWNMLNADSQYDEYLFYFDNIIERDVMEDNFSMSTYYFLDNDVIVIDGPDGTLSYYQAFCDNLGSICSVYAEDGTKVFEAYYDAWGYQVIVRNDINLRLGYTGHEMLPEVGLIDMQGRLYDPAIGRFISCDNFVQEPKNSQNFNRYTYCLNNPLRYTDPTGELFGIDDAVFVFAAANLATSITNAVANGENVWRAAGISLFNSAASFGIGQAFGQIGSVWNEVARAGAHGLISGFTTSLSGGSFINGFISGAASSAIGSYAQSVDMPAEVMLASTTVMGGLVSWATGGDILQGALNGLTIGALNHRVHEQDETRIANHDRLYHGKNAAKKAYKFMIKRSKHTGKEIAAVNCDDGDVLVFRDGNSTETSCNPYWGSDKYGSYVVVNGVRKSVRGWVHVHPYIANPGTKQSETNPLLVSLADINNSRDFGGWLTIIHGTSLYYLNTNDLRCFNKRDVYEK